MKKNMVNFFQKIKSWLFNGKKQVNSNNLAWFPVWEDPDLISKIRFSAYKSNPKALKTGVKVNLQLVEFTTEVQEEVISKIPLITVNNLMSRFDAIKPEKLFTHSTDSFHPKVVKIENPIFLMGDALENYEVQIEQIKKHGLAEAAELAELLEKLRRTDKDIIEEGEEEILSKLHARLFKILENNPALKRDVIFESGKRRTPRIINFLGKDYCLLFSHFGKFEFNDARKTVNGGNMLPILIPKEGFQMLPYGEMFFGRVLGVIYLNPQPIFKNLGPGICLIAGAISVAMQPEILNK